MHHGVDPVRGNGFGQRGIAHVLLEVDDAFELALRGYRAHIQRQHCLQRRQGSQQRAAQEAVRARDQHAARVRRR